jgi:hypothetical protein
MRVGDVAAKNVACVAEIKNFETAAGAYRFIGLSGAEIRCRSLQGVEPLRLGGSTGMTAHMGMIEVKGQV